MDDNTLYLAHHGVLGQKWGVRRYQNPDGSLTSAGKKRYDKITNKYDRRLENAHHHNLKIAAERGRNRVKIQRKIEKLEGKKASTDSINKQNRYDTKIQKKVEKLKDFDDATKYVKAGQKRYEDVIKDYKNLRLESITNSDAKKTRNAKYVINQYQNQRTNDLFGYGQDYQVLTYAGEYARQHYGKDSKK